MLLLVLSVFLLLLALLAASTSTYLLFLTVAAAGFGRPRARKTTSRTPTRRFAILVPAHNEQELIGRLLANLWTLDYPAALRDVWVVADNCDDETANIARAQHAGVLEHVDANEHAKGFALRWLLRQLEEQELQYDAYVVLDADSVVAPNFLRSMDRHLENGSQVVQAYYSVLNASASPLASLRFAALAALHYVRPLGRSVLGLSVGLKGNGMCFAAPVLRQFGWNWFSLAEDVEFHLALVQAGVRVDFAPDTSVLADMPVTLTQAASQNARWERGRADLAWRCVPGLVATAWRRRSPMVLDAAVEQLIPPLSVPLALSLVCLIAGLGLSMPVQAALGGASLAGQIVYLLTGLALVGAPIRSYRALAYAPVYLVWKLGLYSRALIGSQSHVWVRTARAPDHSA